MSVCSYFQVFLTLLNKLSASFYKIRKIFPAMEADLDGVDA